MFDNLNEYLNKTVLILYLDTGQEIILKGNLKKVDNDSLVVETDKNIMILPFTVIKKIKFDKHG